MRSSSKKTGSRIFNIKPVFPAAFTVAVLTVILYLPALRNGFVNWDDELYVLDNPYIRSMNANFFRWAFFDFYSANWHPLSWLSHALDYLFWGLDPAGHHLTGVVLHGINTFIVVLLVVKILEAADLVRPKIQERLFSGRAILMTAVTSGLLFGLHPIHVESVAWVSERKDVLCAFFYFLSLLSYTHYLTNEIKKGSDGPYSLMAAFKDRGYLFSLVFFVLALMSKPMAVTIPVVITILDWYPFRRPLFKHKFHIMFIEKVPFFLLSIIAGIITLKAQSYGNISYVVKLMPFSTRILVAFKAVFIYLKNMVLPLDLVPFYAYPKKVPPLSPEYLVPVLFAAVVTVSGIAIVKRHRLFLAIWAYYIVTLLPVIGIIKVGEQSMADRYTYIPSLGPFLLAGLGVAFIADKLFTLKRFQLTLKAVSLSFALLIIAAMSTLTLKQINVWKDSLTLWGRVIEISPNIPKPYHQRGNALRVLGYNEEAVTDFTRAIRLDPFSVPNYYCDRGIAYANSGRFQEAVNDFSTAAAMDPANSIYLKNLENAKMELDKLKDPK